MAYQVISLSCPCCGYPVSADMTDCPAGHPLSITSFNSVYNMPAPMVNKYAGAYKKALATNPDDIEINNGIAMCYLKLKLYDKALPAFEKAMEDNFDNSETFFYAAVCLLQGKKPFVTLRPVIDKIEEYINAALMIEPRGIYYYFLAYIKYDYFNRKYFKTSPTYQEALAMAKQAGYSPLDTEALFATLGVEKPTGF